MSTEIAVGSNVVVKTLAFALRVGSYIFGLFTFVILLLEFAINAAGSSYLGSIEASPVRVYMLEHFDELFRFKANENPALKKAGEVLKQKGDTTTKTESKK